MQLRSFFKKAYRMAKAAPIAFAFLAIALFGTILSYVVVRGVILREGEQRFGLLVSELRTVVVSRVNHTIDLPVTMAKSISPEATKGELDGYIKSLQLESRYPGAREVGIYATTGENKSLKRLYRYTVVPEAIGLSESELKNAVNIQATANGNQPFFLKLREREPSYAVLVPIESNTYLFMVFDATTVLSRLFNENSVFNYVNFKIFDTTDPEYPLYETTEDPLERGKHTFYSDQQFRVGLYPWSMQTAGDNRELLVPTARRMPAVILFAGIAISFLMFGILFALSWSRKSALNLADSITKNLRSSEEKYRSIFESLQDVYYRTDKDGLITTVSPSVMHYVGLPPEQLVGKPATSFYKNPKERDGMLAELARSGTIKDYPLTLVGVNGDIFYCSLNAHIVKDANGNIAGVEGLIRDVSGRKRADDALLTRTKELERLNSLMIGRELRMVELKKEIAELKATPLPANAPAKAAKAKLYGKK
ncbi:MAG TPA: PAS domain S-box protein [Candidatus Paceibacterota bacterium]|nr:PAS domain S-box protein [Candidatus Paceibacterota bacterium]